MMKRSISRVICAVLTAVMIWGMVPIVPAHAANLSISLSAYSLKLNPNASASLQARVATGLESLVTWRVSDASIARIAATGSPISGASAYGASITVTALNAGQTVLTASMDGGGSAQCLLTVSGAKISPTSVTLSRGGEQMLSLIRYGDAENVSWTWTSSNPAAVRVEAAGNGPTGSADAVIHALAAGNAVITATGGSYTAGCQVSVDAAFATPVANGFLRSSTQDGFLLTYWFDAAAAVANALCGVYDAADRLLAVRTLDLSSTASADGTRQQMISCQSAQAAAVKVFTLDAARRPIAPARILSTPGSSIIAPEFVFAPEVSANGWDTSLAGEERCYVRTRIMANRDCVLYWALYPQGGTYASPTAARFRTGTLTGSVRNGTQSLNRNVTFTLELDELPELTGYDLWLWLSDADFTSGSYMVPLNFTTMDCTPPEFLTAPIVNAVRATTIDLSATVSEEATIFWTAVPAGTVFPNTPTGGGTVTGDYAIRQIVSGAGAVRSGTAPATANVPASFTVDVLQPQNTYDIWYTARDASGNYAPYALGDPDDPNDPDCPRGVCMITVSTLDTIAPTVTQEFTRHAAGDESAPYDGTDIRLVFSEEVRRYSTGERFAALYDAVTSARTESARTAARETFAAVLRETVKFYAQSGTTVSGAAQFIPAPERTTQNASTIGDDWVIDYRYATATLEDGKTVLTFPGTDSAVLSGTVSNGDDSAALSGTVSNGDDSAVLSGTVSNGDDSAVLLAEDSAALRLTSGTSYYFRLNDISDTSDYLNRMSETRLDTFTTLPPRAELKTLALRAAQYPASVSYVDMAFSLTPGSTSHTDPDDSWDLILWSDTSCEYEMYVRSRPADSTEYDSPWRKVVNSDGSGGSALVSTATGDTFIGRSLHYHLYNLREMPALSQLKDDRVYEYVIRFLNIDGERDRSAWSATVNFRASVVSGMFPDLMNLAVNLTPDTFAAAIQDGYAQDISSPSDMGFRMTKVFVDTSAPSFATGRPAFSPEDTSVEMRLQLKRPGTVYYLLAPENSVILARDINNIIVNWDRAGEIPQNGADTDLIPFQLSSPANLSIVNPHYDGDGIMSGSVVLTSAATSVTVSGLLPDTNYFAYFVMRGTGQTFSEYAELYRFTTKAAMAPVLSASFANPVTTLTSTRAATLHYALINMDDTSFPDLFSRAFWQSQPSGGRYPELESQLSIRNVLQAMTVNSEGSSASVFDLYASETYKEEVAEYLRTVTTDRTGLVIATRHDAAMTAGSRFNIDASAFAMLKGRRYALIAVAITSSGVESFRAVQPVTLPDTSPPMVIHVSNSLNTDVYNGISLDTCHGRVMLTFDEYLYYKDTSVTPAVLKQVDGGPLSSASRYGFPNFVGVGALLNNYASGLVSVVDNDEARIGQPLDTIELEFTNAQDGAFVAFTPNLTDADGNTRTELLRVTIHMEQTSEGIYTPRVEISSAWDGR